MQNLAGKPQGYTTGVCRDELFEAGNGLINIVPNPEPPGQRGEVDSDIVGELHDFTFTRLWTYWSVSGPMPLDAAERMYATEVGRKFVRVAGHCGCPPPHEWASFRDAVGNEIVIDPDGSQEASFARLCERYPSMREDPARFVRSLDEVPDARGTVDSYHVDTAEGLRLIVNTIRDLHSGNDATGPETAPPVTGGFGAALEMRAMLDPKCPELEGDIPENTRVVIRWPRIFADQTHNGLVCNVVQVASREDDTVYYDLTAGDLDLCVSGEFLFPAPADASEGTTLP